MCFDDVVSHHFLSNIDLDHPGTLSTMLKHRQMPVISKTRLFQYIENFTIKNWKFSNKNSDSFFFIFLLKTYIVGTR